MKDITITYGISYKNGCKYENTKSFENLYFQFHTEKKIRILMFSKLLRVSDQRFSYYLKLH